MDTNNSPSASEVSNLTPTSDQQREDQEEEEEDVKPTISPSVVLFLAPPELPPTLSRTIASQLVRSPSSLTVLDGTSIPWILDHEDVSRRKLEPGASLEVSLKESLPCGEELAWRRNCYLARFPTPSSIYDYWWMIEIPKMESLLPRVDLFKLFEGCRAVFSPDIDSDIAGAVDDTEQRVLLQLVFQALGGTFLGTSMVEGATHFFSADSSENSSSKLCSRLGEKFENVACLHPFWISSSISHGFLLPLELFQLEKKHPLTGITRESSRVRLIQHDPSKQHAAGYRSPAVSHLFETVGVVFSAPATSLPAPANQIFQGRTFFFVQPSYMPDQLGGHPQLILALMEIARRLGGKIASRVETADWIIVGRRKGKEYSHGLGHPEKTLGSLHHFLAHLNPSVTEIIDVRSNLLYFPHPFLSKDSPGPLKGVAIFLSEQYPEKYRGYLETLVKAQEGSLVSKVQNLGYLSKPLVISPTQKEGNGLTDLRGKNLVVILPQFLEETFKNWSLKSYFDFKNSVFLDDDDDVFAPDLPIARVAPKDCVPARMPNKLMERIYSVEERWNRWTENDYYGLCCR